MELKHHWWESLIKKKQKKLFSNICWFKEKEFLRQTNVFSVSHIIDSSKAAFTPNLKGNENAVFPIHFHYNLLWSSCSVHQLSWWFAEVMSSAWSWACRAFCVTPRRPITCQCSQLRDSTSHSESCLLLKQQRLTRCERSLKALNRSRQSTLE